MAVSSMSKTTRRPKAHRSPVVLPVVMFCSAAIAVCMMFGNPYLWVQINQDASHDEAATNQENNQPNAPGSSFEGSVVIGEYKTISQSNDEQRAKNIELAAQTINGVVIEPGQIFSFNDVLGDTENNNSYEIAPVVYGSTMSSARGGGICQVSTALYIAALKADMGIAERHPHSLVTDYAPIGLDATLVYGVMDLKVTNRSDYAIRIEAEAVGQTVTIRMVGQPLDPGTTIDVTSKIVEYRTTDGSPQDTSSGANSEEAAYYVVESYRVYYQDGVMVKSEHLATDTYEVYAGSTVTPTEGGFDPTK